MLWYFIHRDQETKLFTTHDTMATLKKFLNFFSFAFPIKTQAALYILIPGTWANEDGWHTPASSFYKTLQEHLAPHDSILPFYWAGKNSHKSRVIAGDQLALLLKQLPRDVTIIIIAHSHGGNVALLGIEKAQRSIEALCLLGTPINEEAYPLAHSSIKRCYNLFSWSDSVQPVFGYFNRIVPDHPQCVNASMHFGDKEPQHSDLYADHVARHLPTLLKNCDILGKAIMLHFKHNNSLQIMDDFKRTELLEEDARLLFRINMTMFRRRKFYE